MVDRYLWVSYIGLLTATSISLRAILKKLTGEMFFWGVFVNLWTVLAPFTSLSSKPYDQYIPKWRFVTTEFHNHQVDSKIPCLEWRI